MKICRKPIKMINWDNYVRLKKEEMINPIKINHSWISKDIRYLIRKSLKIERELIDSFRLDDKGFHWIDHSIGAYFKSMYAISKNVPILFVSLYNTPWQSDFGRNPSRFKYYLINPKYFQYHESCYSFILVKNYDEIFGEGATDNMMEIFNYWLVDDDLLFKINEDSFWE